MIEDLDAARALFGYVAIDLGFYQTLGAVALFLVVIASLRRWGMG